MYDFCKTNWNLKVILVHVVEGSQNNNCVFMWFQLPSAGLQLQENICYFITDPNQTFHRSRAEQNPNSEVSFPSLTVFNEGSKMGLLKLMAHCPDFGAESWCRFLHCVSYRSGVRFFWYKILAPVGCVFYFVPISGMHVTTTAADD